jgi:hypothetical protein
VNIEELFVNTTKNFLEKQTSGGNNAAKNVKNQKNNKNGKTISIDDIKETKKQKGGCC